ncbi:MAG: 4Fe-4S binding protein [Desulfobacula sp.]|jgi:electron transport complex protein RnfB|nr:4Fe-4S binding protein [Desulfobacula sp.]
MNLEKIYQKLRKFMNTLPTGFPETESGVEIKILKKLFTPEQAGLFMKLTLEPETVESVAIRTGIEPSGLNLKLGKMATQGLLFRDYKDNKTRYQVFHFIVGIYEFQLNTIDKELAEMIEEYLPHFGMALAGAGVKTKQLRVAPVSSAIDTSSPVANYNRVRELIKNQELISVTNCICRKEQGLLENNCDYPHETCFAFGKFAHYYIDNEMGRKINVSDAMEILDLAEESGLVLSPSNTKEISFVCCCCPCCCPNIRYAKFFPKPVDMFKTYYQSYIDPETCTSCQECFERCPMEAIQEGEETSEIIIDRCIGCGLCVSVCPENSISLRSIPGIEDPPEFIEDVFQKIIEERQL